MRRRAEVLDVDERLKTIVDPDLFRPERVRSIPHPADRWGDFELRIDHGAASRAAWLTFGGEL